MTNEQINECNRQIADFMEWQHHPDKGYDEYEMAGLKYHRSWDALMPVIEKIEKLPCPFPKREEYVYRCDFNIMKGFVDLKFTQQHFTKTFHPPVDYQSFTLFYGNLYDHKTKIEAAWTIIVRFVQWYASITTPQGQREAEPKTKTT